MPISIELCGSNCTPATTIIYMSVTGQYCNMVKCSIKSNVIQPPTIVTLTSLLKRFVSLQFAISEPTVVFNCSHNACKLHSLLVTLQSIRRWNRFHDTPMLQNNIILHRNAISNFLNIQLSSPGCKMYLTCDTIRAVIFNISYLHTQWSTHTGLRYTIENGIFRRRHSSLGLI